MVSERSGVPEPKFCREDVDIGRARLICGVTVAAASHFQERLLVDKS